MAPASGAGQSDLWDAAYRTHGEQGVSWYQEQPRVALELIDALGVAPASSVIDVGGGASSLAGSLSAKGFTDVTVLDVSQSAIELSRQRNGEGSISYVCANVLEWQPGRLFDLWHDRAVLHFLVDHDERDAYLAVLRASVAPKGAVIVATFAEDGPQRCSGLPVARYSATQLGSLLAPEFTVVKGRREAHRTPGCAVQYFTWVAARRR